MYSLGAILYELLAGSLPLDFYRLAFDEVLRRLREQDPPSPSNRVRSLPGTHESTAKNRGVDPLTLVRQLRGDPDAITLKALEKNRNRRYSSAADLASDIRRYLENEPVTAHPPSASYRARKYIRRNRGLVFSLAVLFAAIAAGASLSTLEAIRARRAESRAEQEAASAQAVVDFLEHDLLAQASTNNQSGPQSRPDPDLKVRIALDRAAQSIHGKFENQPEIEASIRYTIGDAYSDLGLLPEARAQVERAMDLRRRIFGKESIEALQTLLLLEIIAQHQGKLDEAETLCRDALESSTRVLGTEHRMTLTAMGNLMAIYLDEGKFAQEEELGKKTLETTRRILGPEHRLTINVMTNLATAYSGQGKYAQANALFLQNLEISRRVLGPEHSSTLNIMQDLAVDYSAQGKFEQSEALDKQVSDSHLRLQGPEHPDTLNAMNNLAMDYTMEGKYAQAETLIRQTLEVERRVMGPEHPDTLGAMGNLAEVERLLGNYARAKVLFDETLSKTRRVLGPEHPNTLSVVSGLAALYQCQGEVLLAQVYATEALTGYRHAKGSEDPDTMSAALDLALANLSDRKFTDGEALAREALQTDHKIQPESWQRYFAASVLGASLAGEKKYDEAEPLLLEGYEGMEARRDVMGAPNRDHLNQARRWIVALYKAWGKPERAAQWIQKGEQ